MLAEEEAAQAAAKKIVPKAGAKKGAAAKTKPAGPGAIAAGDSLDAEGNQSKGAPSREEPVESFAATGIDNALELLDVVTAKMDKASIGTQAAGIEKHPEVRR